MKKLYEDLRASSKVKEVELNGNVITLTCKDGTTGIIIKGEIWNERQLYDVRTNYKGMKVENLGKSYNTTIRIFEMD